MSFLYNIIIHLYHCAILVSSLINDKARQWRHGRKGLLKSLNTINPEGKPLIWIHCASLGEFELGRPVIESIRKNYQGYYILLTFFSPSGYEIRKDYDQVNHVSYLPIDIKRNAERFLDIVRPTLALFVKYEFWFNYIQAMSDRSVPLVIISANFRKDQHFFKWYGGWFRNKLKMVSRIFVQRKDSLKLLETIGYDNATISGDTRFDRVAAIASQAEEIDIIKEFKGDLPLILAGSTWPRDEEIILPAFEALKERCKLVIAPHEVHPERIKQLKEKTGDPNILIIDTMGMLSRLYRYADLAYIGGGFGAGIHNILEAAAFGCPVVFGPNYYKFKEAVELKELGGAFSITDEDQVKEIFEKFIKDKASRDNASEIAAGYVMDNKGATSIILDELKKYLI